MSPLPPPPGTPASPAGPARLSGNARALAIGLAVACCLLSAVVVLAAPRFLGGVPALFRTPTVPPCGTPTLTLGSTQFAIETIARAGDGAVPIPADTAQVAFWVEGTDPQYVFALSPTPGNLALVTSLQADDEATVTWANCNATTYQLASPVPSPLNTADLVDQAAAGITIFVPASGSTEGVMVAGDLAAEDLVVINTPVSGPEVVQAEISLLGTSVADGGTQVLVEISILNTGSNAFTVTASDVSLLPEGATAAAPSSAAPELPLEIQPGASETISLLFPKPAASTAVLRVFDVEYDVEGW